MSAATVYSVTIDLGLDKPTYVVRLKYSWELHPTQDTLVLTYAYQVWGEEKRERVLLFEGQDFTPDYSRYAPPNQDTFKDLIYWLTWKYRGSRLSLRLLAPLEAALQDVETIDCEEDLEAISAQDW